MGVYRYSNSTIERKEKCFIFIFSIFSIFFQFFYSRDPSGGSLCAEGTLREHRRRALHRCAIWQSRLGKWKGGWESEKKKNSGGREKKYTRNGSARWIRHERIKKKKKKEKETALCATHQTHERGQSQCQTKEK